jgi:hypothetical protein
MTHLLPTTPINTESDAAKASKASAIAIFIGVAVGIIGAIWTLMHPEILANAVAHAEATTPGAGAMAQSSAQMGIYLGYGLIVVQAIFGLIQWRSPAKWIAILFIVLIVLGFLMTAAAPVLAGMVPNAPATPMWQIALSLVILVVQLVLHITGLKGIGKLEKLQLDSANSAY